MPVARIAVFRVRCRSKTGSTPEALARSLHAHKERLPCGQRLPGGDGCLARSRGSRGIEAAPTLRLGLTAAAAWKPLSSPIAGRRSTVAHHVSGQQGTGPYNARPVSRPACVETPEY